MRWLKRASQGRREHGYGCGWDMERQAAEKGINQRYSVVFWALQMSKYDLGDLGG